MSTDAKKKQASADIAALIKEAKDAVSKAEKIADETGVGFSFNVGGYGMGGWYTPKAEVIEDQAGEHDDPDWEPSEGEYGWQSSSSSC